MENTINKDIVELLQTTADKLKSDENNSKTPPTKFEVVLSALIYKIHFDLDIYIDQNKKLRSDLDDKIKNNFKEYIKLFINSYLNIKIFSDKNIELFLSSVETNIETIEEVELDLYSCWKLSAKHFLSSVERDMLFIGILKFLLSFIDQNKIKKLGK